MISMITLGALGLLTIIGLGKMVLKDFRFSSIIPIIFIAMVVGLNFINPVAIGAFDFRIGTLIFYLVCVTLFFFNGRFITQMTALSIALVLGGLAYAATRLASLGTAGMFSDTNYVYALIIGVLSFVLTRNGKYAFVVSSTAMLLFNMLLQIGMPYVSLDHGFDWTIIAMATSVILYAITARVALKPSKMSYFFEAGRLED